MDDPRPPRQRRSAETRARIVGGVIEVLARDGAAGTTHRAVARVAGVSGAATTYHFATKGAMIEAASQALLDGYVADFGRFDARLASGAATGVAGLGAMVNRVTATALHRQRIRSLAWCEIMLEGGRDPARRDSVAAWYRATDGLWRQIARRFRPDASAAEAREAVDQVVGITFLLHPLHPTEAQAEALLSGALDLSALLPPGPGAAPPDPCGPARLRVIEAAVDLLIEAGPAGISHRSVADRAGLVRSGPAHHFARLGPLVEAAQQALLARKAAQDRAALAGIAAADGPLPDRIVTALATDLTRHGREALGAYTLWVVAAQAPTVRDAVAQTIAQRHAGWGRLPGMTQPRAFRLQGQFVGQQIRALATGCPSIRPGDARAAFAAILEADLSS